MVFGSDAVDVKLKIIDSQFYGEHATRYKFKLTRNSHKIWQGEWMLYIH